MNEQPEAAAKAAETIFKRYTIEGMDACDEAIAAIITEAFQPILTSRDEQLAALTDKLATVTAESEEWKEKACIFESQVENADAYLEQTKLNVKAEVTALRARVAELERELDEAERSRSFNHGAAIVAIDERDEALRTCKELEQQRDVAIHFKEEAQSELAKVRREKEEEAESYAAVIRINGSQHETIRDGLYRKLDALQSELAQVQLERNALEQRLTQIERAGRV